MRLLGVILFSGYVLPVSLMAQGSSDYQLTPMVVDLAGLRGGSHDYTVDSSSSAGGSGISTDYALRAGYAGQLMDATSISIDETTSPVTLNEKGTLQLTVTAVYDDLSRSTLPGNFLSWLVQSGPLASISSSGLVTAGSVYQNTAAVGRATYGSLSDTVSVSVLNVGNDDFGPYAADGMSDLWQVGYFGETGSQGGSALDPDGDGLSNLQEYAFGLSPIVGSAPALSWSGSQLQQRGVPLPYANKNGSTFTFRAVFVRRKDYLAAGLRYAVEFSGDLTDWRASSSTPSVIAEDSEVQAVSVPYPFFVNGKKARFFRVRVETAQ
jgi:hypothetical protein